jgi:hypothetical protein
MYAHERENWGMDLKNERVNLSKHINTAMFATTNVRSVSENRALVVTQHIVKKKKHRLTEMNCVVYDHLSTNTNNVFVHRVEN